MKTRNFSEDITTCNLWDSLYNCFKQRIPIVGNIVKYNERFGYTVDIDGILVDMSQSEISNAYIDDFQLYVGKTFLFSIVYIDRHTHTIKVSRKRLSSKLKAGMAIRGMIIKIQENRMFVDVGFRTRIHIRNMDDSFIKDINAKFHIGQMIDVVLEEDYMPHSYSDATSKPSVIWETITKSLKLEDILEASVVSTSDVGLIVNVDNIYDGFIHSCHLTPQLKRRFNNKDIKVGESIEVAITGINSDDRKIYLSTLPVQKIRANIAWNSFFENIEIDTVISGTIDKVLDSTANSNGVIVKFNEFVTGYIPYYKLTKQLQEDLQSNTLLIGQTVEAAVTSVDIDKRKIQLSMKRVIELDEIKDWSKYFSRLKIDSILSATVVEHTDQRLCLKIGDFTLRSFPVSCLTVEYLNILDNHEVEIGDNIPVAVTRIDTDKQKLQISMSRVIEISKERAINDLKSSIKCGYVLEAKVLAVTSKYAKVQISGTEVEVLIDRDHLSQDKVVDAREIVYAGEIISVAYLGEDNGRLLFDRKALTMSSYRQDIYDLPIEELLAKQGIDTNLFVGRAVTMGENVFFHDVASVGSKFDGEAFFEGRLLQDYITARPSIVLVNNKNAALKLSENGYYQFSIALAPKKIREEQGSPFIYQTATNSQITPVDNPYKKAVELVFSKQESPEQNKIIASLLREVGSQLYSERSRMLFELLQNADDAAPSRDQDKDINTPNVQVRIDIMENGLLFQHNGCAFNFEDFYSITSAANSTKGTRKRSTGYKGIGFKSVFTNCKSVSIQSHGFRFGFDKNNPIFDSSQFDNLYQRVRTFSSEEEKKKFFTKYAKERCSYKGIDDIPWQIMPFWLDDVRGELLAPKPNENVVIGLAMDIQSRDEYQAAIQEVFDNPRMFLFLRHTRRLQLYNLMGEGPQTIQKDYDAATQIITLTRSNTSLDPESYKLFHASDIEISDNAFEAAGIDIKIKREEKNGIEEFSFVEVYNGEEGKKVNNIPNKIASAQSTTISIAFNVDEESGVVPIKLEDAKSSFYAYLPLTENRFKFPFFVNADFILSSSREGLQVDNKWNIFLFYHLGRIVVNAICSVANFNNREYLKLFPAFLEADKTYSDLDLITEAFNGSYTSALNSEKFILDDMGILRSQDEIILDCTGLSEIIGYVPFLSLLGTNKHLPSKAIDTTPLKSSLFRNVEDVDFKDMNEVFRKEIAISILNNWLSENTDRKDILGYFFSWLLENEKLAQEDIISRLDILPFNGTLLSAADISNSAEPKYVLSAKAFNVHDILCRLGLSCTDEDLSHHAFYEYIPFTKDVDIYEALLSCDLTILSYEDRLSLFRSMDKWTDVGEAKLKKITLFRNSNDQLLSLEETLLPREDMPNWYSQYVISEEEMTDDVKRLLPETPRNNFDRAISLFLKSGFTSALEFYNVFAKDGVWNTSDTVAFINQFGCDDMILSIAESEGKSSQEAYIDNLEKLALSSNLSYLCNSREYRTLKMAIEIGKIQVLRNKTYIDNIPLNQYAISDTVIYAQGDYKLSLSEILPDFSAENALGKIVSNFSEIPNIESFFSQGEKSHSSIRSEFIKLICNNPVTLNWSQIAFIALEKHEGMYWSRYLNNLNVPTGDDLLMTFDKFIDLRWTDLLKTFFDIKSSELSGIKGKYFDSDNYTLPEERISGKVASWICGPNNHEKRTALLLKLGAYSPTSNEINRRRKFLGEKAVDAAWDIKGNALHTFLKWLVASQPLPIEDAVQRDIIKNLANNTNGIIAKDFDHSRLCGAIEISEAYYTEWRKTSKVSICLIQGQIPYIYKYDGKILIHFENGTVDYSSELGTIYVSAECELEAELTLMAYQSGVPFEPDDWRKLFNVNRSELTKEQEENERLRQRIQQLEEEKGNPANRLQKGDIDENSQKELNRDALIRAEEYLVDNGYDCSSLEMNDYNGVYHIQKDGEDIAFAVASCRGGLIYLHASKFATLMEKKKNLLLIYDGKIVRSLSFNDAFQTDNDVNLIFDVNYITPENMAEIANKMQWYPNTRFVFRNPEYSVADELRTFGLDQKHEGAAPTNISSIDDLD